MLAVAVTLVGLWGVAAMGVYGGLRYEESRLAALRAERERWRQPALDVRTLRRRVFMIERYNDFSRSSLECLREICLLQPAGVELTSFTYRKDDSVKLSGRAANVGQVYDFKSKLDASALFGETTLTGPTLDRRTNEQIFGIDIQLPGGEK
jgi:hypothetical protein